MCTVTYLPLGNNNFILTSNRDEQPTRATLALKEYLEDGVRLKYPKDVLAGGTWIGLSEKNRLICLLNGGFESHVRAEKYKMSRGVIVKAILIAEDFTSYINKVDLIGIEPFTIVLVDWNNGLETYELVWDGVKKHFKKLKQEPKIWSSSKLYSLTEKELRKHWFRNWLINQKEFVQDEVLKFHNDSEVGTPENAIKMKRSYVETVSITSVVKEGDSIEMSYFPLIDSKRD